MEIAVIWPSLAFKLGLHVFWPIPNWFSPTLSNWWTFRRLKVTQLLQELQRHRAVAGRIEGTLQGPEARIRT